jgi:hypothetical protein
MKKQIHLAYFSLFLKNTIIVFLLFILGFESAMAAATGDYRSKATGNWNSTSTWEYYNGSAWVAASLVPTDADGFVNILSGHAVTVSADADIDQFTINSGGSLIIAATKKLTILNGTGTDFTIDGTITINGTLANNGSTNMAITGLAVLANGGSNTFGGGATATINTGGRYRRQDATMTTSSGIWTVNSGGTFQQDVDGGNLPLATWNTGSLCEITGVTVTRPGNMTQSFYNFTWNCPSQTSIENLQGDLNTVNGDFRFVSSGTGKLRLSQGENYTLNVGGNFYVQGGSLYATGGASTAVTNISGDLIISGGTFGLTDAGSSSGDGTPDINISGNFNISGGTLDMSQYTASSAGKGIGEIYLTGNLIQSGGTITETAANGSSSGYGNFYFNKSGSQTLSISSGTMSNKINFTVNSTSSLDMGTSILSGAGDFTSLSGSTLIIGSAGGVTSSSSAGNVQVTGTRTFSTTTSYKYNGTSAQVTGSGLPASISNLIISNSLGVTLTSNVTVTGTLTLTSGNVTTGSNTLTLGSSTSTLGTLSRTSGHVIGNFTRWVAASTTSNILFPIGDANNYKGLNWSFTGAPSAGGTINLIYAFGDPGKNGLNLIDGSDTITSVAAETWTVSTANGLSGGTYSIDVTSTNLPNVTNYAGLHLMRRTNGSSPWTLQGANSAGTGSNAVPIVHRTGLTTLAGQFGIGAPGSAGTLPIQLLYFKAKVNGNIVDLNWATGSEYNCESFIIERSNDGIEFSEILQQPASGNSTSIIFYSNSDENPFHGINYYRLKQIDFDGKSSYSEIKSAKVGEIIENDFDLSFGKIGPNPFTDNFSIHYTLPYKGEIVLQLVNSFGQIISKEVLQAEGENNFKFYTGPNNLKPGLYFINLIFNGKSISRSIIKG